VENVKGGKLAFITAKPWGLQEHALLWSVTCDTHRPPQSHIPVAAFLGAPLSGLRLAGGQAGGQGGGSSLVFSPCCGVTGSVWFLRVLGDNRGAEPRSSGTQQPWATSGSQLPVINSYSQWKFGQRNGVGQHNNRDCPGFLHWSEQFLLPVHKQRCPWRESMNPY
jgi:hypothetical protein